MMLKITDVKIKGVATIPSPPTYHFIAKNVQFFPGRGDIDLNMEAELGVS